MQGYNPALAPGAIFEERYQILARLGEGGFGAVHKARQLTTGQAVALKIMHLPEQDGEARREKRIARFLREMQLCAQLHHPNLVQLVDSGRTGGGLLYTVFAFAPGDDLADLLAKEGALKPREAQHLMLQVLDALACAHAQGVIHRDLKPNNIIVVPTGARRNALVLDFGIGAIAGGADGRDPTRLTMTGETLGTPGYAAPEQWRGLEPTPRADLFAWGLVFLECLTGKPVYGGGSAAEIVYQQLGPEPVPIPPEIERHALGELLRAVTRKDLAARDVTARGLLEALEACDLSGLSGGALREGGALSICPTEAPATTLEGERRQVTAVCCNLRVQALTPGQLVPDAEDELLRAGLALSAEVARRHRGRAVATLGDDLLVYFGYPHAEEDDAPRAARAALAIASAVEAESERSGARGMQLEVKIGVHAGLVVARDPRDTGGAALAAGGTPRLAARLARIAPPGGVLVTADAHRLLRGSFELEAEGKQSVEGADASIKVFRLGRGERVTGPTSEGAQTPLVGRDQEMDLLLDRWRRARAGGGQCGLITGEPGIGKSRLARELRDRLANEVHTFVEGRCSPDTRNNALHPVLDLLGRALGVDREPSPAGKVAQLEAQLARHGLTPADAMPLFLPLFSLAVGAPYAPLDVSPQKQKDLTLNAILALLFAMAEERPVLFVVEDLHWADPTTLELLGQLVREAPSAPICLLLTARPEFSPAFSTTGVLQLHLNRLERAQIEAMVGDLVGKKALPPVVLEQVANRTDGVPLFVEELTRMMVESGSLVEHADRYELSGALSDVEIPGTLRGLLTARLDRLGRAKETAQLAAALGREFSVAVHAAVSTLDATAVQEDLDRLMGAGLVFWKRRMKDPGCVFKHALVRDAAYESLTVEARRKVHARIAATLEERFPAMVEGRPDLLAHHHAAAEQKRAAIGYAQRAAMRALMRSAYAEAIGHASAALDWLGTIADMRERADLELGLNGVITPALMSTRGWADSKINAKVQRSQELIEQVGHSAYSMPTLWASVLFHHVGGRNRAEARATAAQMVDLARKGNDESQEIAARAALGHCCWIDGSYAQARAEWESAIGKYRPEEHAIHATIYGHDSRAWASMGLGEALWFMGYPDQALARARAAIAWSKELNHANTLAQAYMFSCLLHYDRQEPGPIIESANAVLELERRHGLPPASAYTGVVHGWASGDLALSKRHLANLEGSGHALAQPYFRAVVAGMEAARGEHVAALDRIEGCLKLCEDTGERYYLAELLRLKGVFTLQSDPRAEALAEGLFRQAAAIAEEQGVKMLELGAIIELCRILQRRRPDEARALLCPIYEWFSEGFDSLRLRQARALLEELGAHA